MRKPIVPAALALAVIILAAARPFNAPVKVTLLDAVRERWITLEAQSTGGNSEECVTLKIKNTSGKPLQLTVEPATVFNTEDNSDQDIVVTRPTDVLVQAGQTTTAKAFGFCCQASNGLSNEGDRMIAEACKSPKLAETARYLAAKKYDPDLQQHAIWAVSDNHSIGGIYSDNRLQCDDLRGFTAGLLGQPVPNYDLDYGYELNTPFVFAPKTLSGSMQYKVIKPGRASLQVFDPEGELYQVFYDNRYMESGNYTQRFSLTATGMIPGAYVVKLIIDGMEWQVQTITV
jgi:hypothetical protein